MQKLFQIAGLLILVVGLPIRAQHGGFGGGYGGSLGHGGFVGRSGHGGFSGFGGVSLHGWRGYGHGLSLGFGYGHASANTAMGMAGSGQDTSVGPTTIRMFPTDHPMATERRRT